MSTKTKELEFPSWFPKEFKRPNGGEVSNPNHPNPDWRNQKIKLNKVELSVYSLIKNTETELRYYSEYYSKDDLSKMIGWFNLGLQWFRTTNPKGYMRLLD